MTGSIEFYGTPEMSTKHSFVPTGSMEFTGHFIESTPKEGIDFFGDASVAVAYEMIMSGSIEFYGMPKNEINSLLKLY